MAGVFRIPHIRKPADNNSREWHHGTPIAPSVSSGIRQRFRVDDRLPPCLGSLLPNQLTSSRRAHGSSPPLFCRQVSRDRMPHFVDLPARGGRAVHPGARSNGQHGARQRVSFALGGLPGGSAAECHRFHHWHDGRHDPGGTGGFAQCVRQIVCRPFPQWSAANPGQSRCRLGIFRRTDGDQPNRPNGQQRIRRARPRILLQQSTRTGDDLGAIFRGVTSTTSIIRTSRRTTGAGSFRRPRGSTLHSRACARP